MARRILAILLLFFSTLFFPFWMTTILGIGAMAYFPKFWEIILIALVVDLLYAVPEVQFYGTVHATTIGTAATLLLVEFLKKKLKYYPEH